MVECLWFRAQKGASQRGLNVLVAFGLLAQIDLVYKRDFSGLAQGPLMVLRAKTTAGRDFHAKLQGLAVLLSILLLPRKQPQRFHVGIWYLVGAQKASHVPTLRPSM